MRVAFVDHHRDTYGVESVINLFKTEVIQRKGPWRHLEAVEFATLTWVDWFNTRRLLEPIGYVPPAEYEARYYEQLRRLATTEGVRPAACGDDADAAPTSTCRLQEGLAGGIFQPAPTDDRRSWGIL